MLQDNMKYNFLKLINIILLKTSHNINNHMMMLNKNYNKYKICEANMYKSLFL